MLEPRQQQHGAEHGQDQTPVVKPPGCDGHKRRVEAEHDRAGLGTGVDAAHFCNYLCTLYHIKAVGVQVVLHGQASGTDSHKGCKYPSCQHSSGVGVSVPV